MAKHKYEELDLDEHNLAIHYKTREDIEVWCTNEYYENGKIKDVHIKQMKFPEGYKSPWFDKVYTQDTIVNFTN